MVPRSRSPATAASWRPAEYPLPPAPATAPDAIAGVPPRLGRTARRAL